MKQRVEKDQVGLCCKLKDLKADKSPFKEYIKHTVPMLENLVSYYRKSDGNTRKKILSCIISKKTFWRNQKLQPTNTQHPFRFYSMPARFAEGQKKRQEVETDLLSCMAPLMDGSCNCFAFKAITPFNFNSPSLSGFNIILINFLQSGR